MSVSYQRHGLVALSMFIGRNQDFRQTDPACGCKRPDIFSVMDSGWNSVAIEEGGLSSTRFAGNDQAQKRIAVIALNSRPFQILITLSDV
jgi:hypothetical protein